MMHKFHHIEAKPSLEGELRVLWKIVPKTNLPDELHVHTGEKPYKRSHCNKCGKCLQNRRLREAQI